MRRLALGLGVLLWLPRVGAAAGDMVWLPAVSLVMGEAQDAGQAPAHRVAVSDFALDRREVRNAEFARFVAVTGHVTDAERSDAG